jgi:3-oxoadipate enol-lactonase
LAGTDDPSTPPAELEAIAAEIPNARLVVLEDARHLVNVEQPDAFNDALASFL